MVRFSLWFVALALAVRRSERIFWNRSARRLLLGVLTRRGKSVFKSLSISLAIDRVQVGEVARTVLNR